MDIEAIERQLLNAGLQRRNAQLSMIQSVYDALKAKEILCLEAATGTGKTLSYGLAALHALGDKQHLVICTATISLQNQLIRNDLPLLKKISEHNFRAILIKGRNHYICHQRLYEQQSTTSKRLTKLLQSGQWNGDREHLPLTIDDAQWQSFTADSKSCSGKQCPFFDDCVYLNQRKSMHRADIIVTNHSVLLSDLELGGGILLPKPERCVFIIDECHHLPERALHHFTKSTGLMTTTEWLNQLNKYLPQVIAAEAYSDSLQDRLTSEVQDFVGALKEFHQLLTTHASEFVDDTWVFTQSPTPGHDITTAIAKHSAYIYQQVTLMHDALDKKLQATLEKDEALQKLLAFLGFLSSRAESCYLTWKLYHHKRQAKEAPIARWVTRHQHHFTLHASPINVSQALKNLFWDKLPLGVLLCSATIRSLGSFKEFQRKSGLLSNPRYREQFIAPFFDYTKSLLYLPRMSHAPGGKNDQAHLTEMAELLPQLILQQNGTLVLFTSYRAMDYIYQHMPASLVKDILKQGRSNKLKLLATHKKRIDQHERSVLFGLASFGEGLDLPGAYCQHVIIQKLPFAVPTTPIELVRNEWLKLNQRNPFLLSTLPTTSTRFTQFVGRLIRSETDQGVITILDKRLYCKNYGKPLLDNLPSFTTLINENIDTLKSHPLAASLYKSA